MNDRKEYRGKTLKFCERCAIHVAKADEKWCELCQISKRDEGMVNVWINEEKENWRGMCGLIPPLVFPSTVKVKMQMPFGGVAARFLVSVDEKRYVSVYLDVLDRLGYCGRPHWEIYDSETKETERFATGQEEEMMQAICKVLGV